MLLWWMTVANEYAKKASHVPARTHKAAPLASASSYTKSSPTRAPKSAEMQPSQTPVLSAAQLGSHSVKISHISMKTDMLDARQPTSRTTRERELEEALARAESALRVAEQGRNGFLSVMSHELRTPLNAILGFSEMMKLGVHGPIHNSAYAEYVNHIHDAGGELLSKVNDLLAIGSMESNDFTLSETDFPLSELLADTIAVHSQAAFSRKLRLTLDAPANIELNGDRAQLLCALAHLLSNAINHSTDAMQISISARIQVDEGLIISVRDQGAGMTPAQLQKIRESLQQSASYLSIDGGGIGIGLALTQEIAARHGGRIMIDSIRHRGTVTSLILPQERVVKGMPAKRKGLRG